MAQSAACVHQSSAACETDPLPDLASAMSQSLAYWAEHAQPLLGWMTYHAGYRTRCCCPQSSSTPTP